MRFSGCVPLALVLMMRRPFFSANQWDLVTSPLTSDVSIRCIKKPMGQKRFVGQKFLNLVGKKGPNIECPQEDFDRLWRGPITDVRLREGFFLVEGIFGQKNTTNNFLRGFSEKAATFCWKRAKVEGFKNSLVLIRLMFDLMPFFWGKLVGFIKVPGAS